MQEKEKEKAQNTNKIRKYRQKKEINKINKNTTLHILRGDDILYYSIIIPVFKEILISIL